MTEQQHHDELRLYTIVERIEECLTDFVISKTAAALSIAIDMICAGDTLQEIGWHRRIEKIFSKVADDKVQAERKRREQ